MLREAIRKVPGVPLLIKLNTEFEDWWFDQRYGTDTSADREDQARKGWETDKVNHTYLPIRPKCARRILDAMPLDDPSEYTFIDFGCGKGRMLLMALSRPFGRVIGVELRRELSDRASVNLIADRRAAAHNARCVCINAVDFALPEEKLVLYFFNPFGEEVMRAVLENLGRSLEARFRDVLVVLDMPLCAHVADAMPHLAFIKEGYWYRMYRSRVPPPALAAD